MSDVQISLNEDQLRALNRVVDDASCGYDDPFYDLENDLYSDLVDKLRAAYKKSQS